MAEHKIAQAATSRSPNKSSWLAALDELEQELLTFQKGGGGAGATARADVEAPRSAPKQLGWRPRVGSRTG
jgi:hypothetical protein